MWAISNAALHIHTKEQEIGYLKGLNPVFYCTVIGKVLLNSNSTVTRIATNAVIGAGSETVSGIGTRFAGTMITSDFDIEKSFDNAFDIQNIVVDAALGGAFGGIQGVKKPGIVDGELLDSLSEELPSGVNKGGTTSIESAIASQGNEVYTGIDDWRSVQLKKEEVFYRGEPKGTEFFTTKESIQSVDSNKKQLFEGLQVREDPIYGYRPEMQGYKLNINLDAAQAQCLKNMQFGGGGLEQKYIPNANELISSGVLEPVDKIILK